MFTLNLPNFLTLLRILLVPVLVVALFSGAEHGDVFAAVVFAAASFTDFLDGRIARARREITNFGKLMDPVADKLLVIAALMSLVSLNRLAAWVAMVIVARELAVTVLRAVAVGQGTVISASLFGKAKTLVQVGTIFILILVEPDQVWVQGLIYLTVTVTILSGIDYFFGFARRGGLKKL